ncbi:ABC transporter ATP-binding protein [Mesorhizobium sp. M7A.F.Ca.US.006.01.1.1]|uniref:ABC transporter ATP-binding protein n=1 Tax=Mesorhizobium sp. M7A.F.Ca.US.006.01.1.1 TaxID=2496707 RepID=UPI000FCB9284|nr:ABC transporter ATP-binding protein [Mesorhizobium sp. M7A.F.Ca.US.006.01.1.1]RUZ71010.1 ABC transporter ATP-binding protein [Mesorhizobium sp. M7A.F.Ca.US.006.01.1.1]
MLEIENISCRYGNVAAVKGVSLQVRRGELVSLIGANGAGKTSTLRAISGVAPISTGRILLDGVDIAQSTPKAILMRGLAHCPEGRRVFSDLTVKENLELGAFLRRDRAGISSDVGDMYKRFPVLGERRGQAAGTLSGGEQQMLAIARALMSRPKIVLFDEPSLGLAPTIIDSVFDLISGIRTQGITVLLVEQNAFAALEMCDRAYLLEAGELKREGTGRELLADPAVRAAYLGG